VCTVVCRWRPEESFAVQLLALRDELRSRSFDPPGEWWDDQPGVVGGRDRSAGGSWCVSDVSSGVTAVVLNRGERRVAEPGAPSRGVLPLLGVRHRQRWPEHLDVTGMASFIVVVMEPDALTWSSFDGQELRQEELEVGTYMFTPNGMEISAVSRRFAAGRAHNLDDPAVPVNEVWPEWLAVLDEVAAGDDPSGLIVRKQVGDQSYETVFGQFIAARPGALRLDYLNNPADGTNRPWTSRWWEGRTA
jgi:transport and Golgi organization protein 2